MRISLTYPLLVAVVLLSACSSRPSPVEQAPELPRSSPGEADAGAEMPLAAWSGTRDAFPRPPELEPQVGFWRQVYGVWRRSQVALHDDRHLGVVYELIDLPGPIADQYSDLQKELIRERREYWQARLRDLQQSRSLALPLTAGDQDLMARFEGTGPGAEAVFGAAERVRAQRGLRERFKRGLEISGRYERQFRKIFREYGLPEELAYLPHVESSFQAHARSSAGAVGVWQFTRSAAQRFMTVNDLVDERLDPVASARGAARYLSFAREQLPNWPLTLTSYNHGIAGMRRAREAQGDDLVQIVRRYDHPKFGFASRNFYTEFLAACDVARQPERFFPEGVNYEPPLEAGPDAWFPAGTYSGR